MGEDQIQAFLAQTLPGVATQLRAALGNIHFAAAALAPAEAREADPELDRKAALLDQAYYQMLRLVDNLTVAAYMRESGPLPLSDQDLVALVADSVQRSKSLGELLGLQVEFVCEEKSHICAIYRDSIQQLLFQLLSNAFKFTKAGGSVRVELRFASGQALLSVADTGSGIPAEMIPSLFNRYLHENLLDPPPHGLGLGLPLCRRIAEGLGGSIVAESREGEGTTVTLSIPDRCCGTVSVSDRHFDYAGGFNPTLLALSDALPSDAFRLRNQD